MLFFLSANVHSKISMYSKLSKPLRGHKAAQMDTIESRQIQNS